MHYATKLNTDSNKSKNINVYYHRLTSGVYEGRIALKSI